MRAAIVDDVISTGVTVAALASAVHAAGISGIDVYTTHALFDASAELAMKNAGVEKVYSCDGVLHNSNAISLSPIIVDGLKQWL